ncbi:hypothetical protein SBA6_280055 [Candidatus Sulfopaludibacter sp. SbA6]|nr:hypothetical protein SBA6_280055 [Candidatus Sulfopaludibacter sp. SbA6]
MRGDWLGERFNRGSIVSPSGCVILVTPYSKQSSYQIVIASKIESVWRQRAEPCTENRHARVIIAAVRIPRNRGRRGRHGLSWKS